MTRPSQTSPRMVAGLVLAVMALAGLRLLLPPPDGPADTPAPAAGTPDARGTSPAKAAVAEARAFLDDYVDGGRVVRHDQGGDTVSEGQAWALVMAVALEDEGTAEAIVDWTEAHIARDDGMLAWRWHDGRTVDAQPAADADLAFAWALSRGAEAFGRPTWAARADDLVARLATTSTSATPDGPLLTAGPWASERDPAVVNPSYLWPAPLDWAADQDPAMAGTGDAAGALLHRLVGDDTPLVPDWVTVDADAHVTAIGTPSEPGAPAQHGLDAVRTWIWLASSCDAELRALATAAHHVFAAAGSDVAAVHGLDGTPAVDWQHPATLAAVAAAAHAAGEVDTARARLDAATALHRTDPGYYGGVVTALTRLLLDTDRITECRVRR